MAEGMLGAVIEHSTSQAQRFYHVALESQNSIRILKLQPASAYDAPLCCDLIHYSIDDGQGYTALSYAWDAQIPTSTIICNGKVLGITRNCELAMREMRRARWPRALWIDAICIDQTSLRERSQQVALMDRIYGLADAVVVWLGVGDRRSYEAMDLIAKWASTCTPDQDSDVRQLCRILASLLHRSWFRRMWTIQELLLAKQVIIVCGSMEMSWVSFREGITQVVSIIDRDRPGFFQKIFPGFTLLNALKTPILAFPYRTFGLPLSEVLRLMRVRECSDPKDRVYALYGIFLQQDLRLPHPDYSKSVRHIYTEAAWSAIIRGNSLELLSQLSCRSIADDLPSWVPDFSQNPWFPAEEAVTISNPEPQLSRVSFTFSEDREKLTTLGLQIDEVGPEAEQTANSNDAYAFYLHFLELL